MHSARHGHVFYRFLFIRLAFPGRESQAIIHALNAAGTSVSFTEIETGKGHDAFLFNEPVMFSATNGFL